MYMISKINLLNISNTLQILQKSLEELKSEGVYYSKNSKILVTQ